MFWKKLKSLETILAQQQGTKRGWFTYTELQNLLEYIDVYVLIQKLACFIAVLAISYTAAVLTMVGSMVVTNQVATSCLKTIDQSPQNANFSSQITPSAEKSKNIDAVDVLKTGIFLASIKVCNNSQDVDEVECGGSSWDWWNNPVMQWLGETSKLFDEVELPFDLKIERRFDGGNVVLAKKIELEDHINKATKIRIQEQMERNWHKEWTDSVYEQFGIVKLFLHYFRDVKS